MFNTRKLPLILDLFHFFHFYNGAWNGVAWFRNFPRFATIMLSQPPYSLTLDFLLSQLSCFRNRMLSQPFSCFRNPSAYSVMLKSPRFATKSSFRNKKVLVSQPVSSFRTQVLVSQHQSPRFATIFLVSQLCQNIKLKK